MCFHCCFSRRCPLPPPPSVVAAVDAAAVAVAVVVIIVAPRFPRSHPRASAHTHRPTVDETPGC
eukprot:2276148-Pyramimonas_sp.AAC.1